MSRRYIMGPNRAHHIVIGWDPPLQTFFAQVYDTSIEDEDEQMVFVAETGTPSELARRLGPYAPLDVLTQLLLAADRYVHDGTLPEGTANQLADAIVKGTFLSHEAATDALLACPIAHRGEHALVLARQSGLIL